jgi:hypothetical protein
MNRETESREGMTPELAAIRCGFVGWAIAVVPAAMTNGTWPQYLETVLAGALAGSLVGWVAVSARIARKTRRHP